MRRRAGTMDPPPSTSRADEGRGEGTREENDDENEKDDGRSVEDSRVHSKGLSRGHEHGEGGGHVRVHDSKIDLVPARVDSIDDTTDERARVRFFDDDRRGVLDMSRWGHRGTRGTHARAIASRVDARDVASATTR